ncbi:MAG: outer rane lipoprotein carrier protein LolA [Hymenobacter sp.]|jgi:outer membrane lipoprotein-sorting protein|nr:outer rane lipoprotein carrier protein LolA [Hymenobacter sp.]
MNKGLFLLILLALQSAVALAQPKGYRPVTDDKSFRKNYAKAAENTLSIKSAFKQEKNLSMLSEKINSDGLFYFKKNNKVRMEYTHPYKYLLIINNDKILIQDQQKKKVYSAGDNKLFKVINNVIIDCVQGKALENKDFQAKVFENEKSYCLDLVPQAKEMKHLFSAIRIYIGKGDFSIDQLEMKEEMGDNTIITFVNKQLNTPIRDEVFDVK